MNEETSEKQLTAAAARGIKDCLREIAEMEQALIAARAALQQMLAEEGLNPAHNY